MNRNEEYEALMLSLETLPPELDDSINRAYQRAKKHKTHKSIGIGSGSVCAAVFTFILLVNLSTGFAYAMSKIPLLSDLAKAVAFSPSLKAAVENEYVQPVNLVQTKNGITATIEYLIVDQKQVNVFFTVKSEGISPDTRREASEYLQSDHVKVSHINDMSIDGPLSCSHFLPEKSGDLRQITIDFFDNDVPGSMTIDFDVFATQFVYDDVQVGVPLPSYRPADPKILANFKFTLEFDPYFTAQGYDIPIKKWLALDSQRILIDNIEVYPTHIRVNVEQDKNNAYLLKRLYFSIISHDGKTLAEFNSGMVSTSTTDEYRTSYWIESNYFSEENSLKLSISGADWLDKKHRYVTVNLKDKTAENLPDNIILEDVADRHKENDNGVYEYPQPYFVLLFSVPMGNSLDPYYQPFGFDAKYPEAVEPLEEYLTFSIGAPDQTEEEMAKNRFHVKYRMEKEYPYDTIIMNLLQTHSSTFKEPILIPVER